MDSSTIVQPIVSNPIGQFDDGATNTRPRVHGSQAFSSLPLRKAGRLGSSVTHGSLSSVHIAAVGGMLLGSSSEATVTSIHSELTSSCINRGVPQQAANERNRSAYKTLRTLPLRISIALLEALHHVTYGAALALRQSSQ